MRRDGLKLGALSQKWNGAIQRGYCNNKKAGNCPQNGTGWRGEPLWPLGSPDAVPIRGNEYPGLGSNVLLTRMGVSADHVRHTPRLARTFSTRIPMLHLLLHMEPTILQKPTQSVDDGVMHQRLRPLPLGAITLIVIPVKPRTHTGVYTRLMPLSVSWVS
eukprot:COSAG06_NODE_7480_length_2490_cov_22.873693_1_plen_160_part_00